MADWEPPLSRRRIPVWVWGIGVLVLVGLAATVAGTIDDDELPGLPVETVEQPLPSPEPTPRRRDVPDPSERWQRLPPPPIPRGVAVPAVWTGNRLVVWNGDRAVSWAPDNDGWTIHAPAPAAWLAGWSATWTGAEVLYSGGPRAMDAALEVLSYSPDEDRWTTGPPAPIRHRSGHATAWASDRLYLWGGRSLDLSPLADGASYDPGTGEWTQLPPAPLSPRTKAVAVWLAETGELLVWGGTDGSTELVDGAAFRPSDGTWRRVADAPWAYRLPPAAVGDGQRRLYTWGLPAAGLHLPSGAVYDAVEDAWEPLPDLLAQERASGSATLAGDGVLVVWGGVDRNLEHVRLDGFVLDVGSGRWRQIAPAPIDRHGGTAIWMTTSSVEGLLVWGSEAGGALLPGPVLTDPLVGLEATPSPEE